MNIENHGLEKLKRREKEHCTWYKLLIHFIAWNLGSWFSSFMAKTCFFLVESGLKKEEKVLFIIVFLQKQNSIFPTLILCLSLSLFIFSPSQKTTLGGERLFILAQRMHVCVITAPCQYSWQDVMYIINKVALVKSQPNQIFSLHFFYQRVSGLAL